LLDKILECSEGAGILICRNGTGVSLLRQSRCSTIGSRIDKAYDLETMTQFSELIMSGKITTREITVRSLFEAERMIPWTFGGTWKRQELLETRRDKG